MTWLCGRIHKWVSVFMSVRLTPAHKMADKMYVPKDISEWRSAEDEEEHAKRQLISIRPCTPYCPRCACDKDIQRSRGEAASEKKAEQKKEIEDPLKRKKVAEIVNELHNLVWEAMGHAVAVGMRVPPVNDETKDEFFKWALFTDRSDAHRRMKFLDEFWKDGQQLTSLIRMYDSFFVQESTEDCDAPASKRARAGVSEHDESTPADNDKEA